MPPADWSTQGKYSRRGDKSPIESRADVCHKVSSKMNSGDDPPGVSRPQGTVVIVAVFGALVVLGWLLMFFGLFVPRGTH
jgi:hypothetical protein